MEDSFNGSENMEADNEVSNSEYKIVRVTTVKTAPDQAASKLIKD